MLWKNNKAVSTVVASMLILVVITTFVSVINAYYIPSISAKHEIDHMREVHESFQKIEETVNLYSYIESKNTSPSYSPSAKVTIPLGDGGLPVISSLSSSGTLSNNPENGWFNISVNYTETNGNNMTYQLNQSTGYFEYRATNNFWIDQQFTFENGAILLTQGQKSLIRSPAFSVSENENTLNVCAFNVSGNSDALSGNGFSTIGINVANSEYRHYTNVSSINIKMNSEHPDAWKEYFQSRISSYSSLNGSEITLNSTRYQNVNILSSDVRISIE